MIQIIALCCTCVARCAAGWHEEGEEEELLEEDQYAEGEAAPAARMTHISASVSPVQTDKPHLSLVAACSLVNINMKSSCWNLHRLIGTRWEGTLENS